MKKLYHFLVTNYKLHTPQTSYLKPLTPYLFLLSAFCFLHFSALAQPYKSIFGNEKTQFNIFYFFRAMKNEPCCGITEIFHVENDTIIEEQLYKKISCGSRPYYSGIREDTIEGKIYVYDDPFGEILTCDFNLSVGDTFFFPQDNPYGSNPNNLKKNNGFMIADSVYSIDGQKTITFDGPYYKEGDNVYKYYFDFFPKVIFIEGIGPNYGPFDWSSEQQMLLCVHKDDDLVYMQQEDIGCELDNPGGGINDVDINKIKIIPNPVYTEFNVQSDAINLDEVFIYTIQGQCVSNIKIDEEFQKINIAGLQAGFYLLKVKDIQGNFYTTKIIKL